MAAILVAGFGVVVAVNFLMAGLALRGFGGVVVENSYVASQQFNGWLEKAERQKALGWTATVFRGEGGRLAVETAGVPDGAGIAATLRRPLGRPETTDITFMETGPDRYHSREVVAPGRWTIRLVITSGGKRWFHQEPIE
jgi:nitrogen fixation protein FixH